MKTEPTSPRETRLRLEIVDKLLRARPDGTPYGEKEGASYRDMVHALNVVDEATKRALGLPLELEDEEIFPAMRGRMQKTLESLCDIYASVHGKDARQETREKLLIEIPRTKKNGVKLFRYRDSSYSLFESGDYQAFQSKKESISIQVYPSAYEELQAFSHAQKMLKEKTRELSQGFIMRRLSANRNLYKSGEKTWIVKSIKNLEEAIGAVRCSDGAVSKMMKARLLLDYSALLLLMGEGSRAVPHLKEAIALCKTSQGPDAKYITEQANNLLQKLTPKKVRSIYANSFSHWKKDDTPIVRGKSAYELALGILKIKPEKPRYSLVTVSVRPSPMGIAKMRMTTSMMLRPKQMSLLMQAGTTHQLSEKSVSEKFSRSREAGRVYKAIGPAGKRGR